MSLTLQFLGAAATVTGSKYLLSDGKNKVLVDCGLFQGLKNLRLKNWNPLGVNAAEIDAIVLTHAHIDHSGYIPRLVKDGFKGAIYCSQATRDLCAILLPDAAYLMSEEAEYLNKHKASKHSPALPLFTEKDAEDCLKLFKPVAFDQEVALTSNIKFRLQYAGHILGAASALVQWGDRHIAFSGDIGRLQDHLMYPPKPLSAKADYVVVESTYGNRLHKNVDILDELADVINKTVSRKGVILIPAFAVGRAQSLIYDLYLLKKAKRIPSIPMYLNSPMAVHVSRLLSNYHGLHKIPSEICEDVCRTVEYVTTVDQSKALNERKGPMLIISASGMLTGGRVLHHLKAFAPYPENTILLSGFQAAGTRGEALENGAEEVKVHGQYIPVRAEIKSLDNTSAHADYKEIIKWLSQTQGLKPRQVFVTHGEASAADEMRRRLGDAFGWQAMVPQPDETVVLE